MANISQELAAIMAAVYGRDVRSSIHDAIDKINQASECQLAAGTAITSTSSSSEGFMEGSLYINTNTYDLWKCTGTDTWLLLGSIKGVDGRSISPITGPVSSGLVDTYTINYSDGTESTFAVTNGADGEDGATWYRGTALTGTGTGLTGYPGKANDFYLNPTTGYVYQCSRTGDVNTALWDYAMAITGGSGGSVVVIDNLNSNSGTDALSARQGKNLNENKIGKPANPSIGDLLGWDGNDWVPVAASAGHTMSPDPASQDPGTAALREAAIVSAILAGIADGWDNDDVASLNTIGHWSNAMIKTYLVAGTSVDSPIGTSGIGTWYEGNPASIDPSTDEADWISIPELIGMGTSNSIAVDILFDPTKSKAVMVAGYQVDDTTGKMCIKFGCEMDSADTQTAVIGIELTIRRTEVTPVS